MVQVECIEEGYPTSLTEKVNTKISSLVSSGYEVLNVYPVAIGDARYVSVLIVYENQPKTAAQFVTVNSLNSTLTTYAKKTDIPTVPTKVSQLTNDSNYVKKTELPSVPTKVSELTNDSGYITQTIADGLYEPKAAGA